MTPSIYCPACRTPLGAPGENGALTCAACEHTVPVRDGIPLLGQSHDYYYAEVPLAAMEWFLAEARAGRATGAFERPAREGPWDFLLGSHFDPTRGAWKLACRLPATRYARVLDFGCGWGVNSVALAPHADEVVAMDLSWHRLAALRLTARTQGLDNLTVLCGGDVLPLPFPDRHFDCVALIGLIEWIPVGRRGNPRRHQLAFLEEIARVTRPDAEIFLASENRYAYSYWVGRPDDHTGLVFGSLLPRPVADLYSRLARREPYQHYTYSRAQYRRLLGAATFRHTEFHGLVPAHRLYHKMFPLSRGRIVDDEETRGAALKDRLLRARWAAPLVSAFGIRAAARPLSASWLQRLCAELRTRPGLEGLDPEPYRLITTNFCVKAAIRVQGMIRGSGVLVRIPLTDLKGALVTNACARQQRWRDHPVVGPLIGSTLDAITFEGWTLTIEALSAARPGRPADGAAAWRQTAELLRTFAGVRGRGSVRDVLDVRLSPAFRDHLGDAHRAALDTLFAFRRLAGIPTCWQHGDFHWENLLSLDGALARVVDWEWASPDGIPLADFFQLAANDAGVGFGDRVVPALAAAAHGQYPRPGLHAIADALREHDHLDAEDLRLLAVAWIYDVLRQHWEATASYGLGSRFLPAPIRRVADRVPPLVDDLLATVVDA